MEISPHTPLDWEALAASEARLAGRLDAATLHRRLADALGTDRPAGEVRYELEFRYGTAGAIRLGGRLRAQLVARCQRCLEPFEIAVDSVPKLVIPSADKERAPEEGWEVAQGGETSSLAALIEDELLLALPISPRHPDAACPALGDRVPEAKSPTQRPFRGLAEAMQAQKPHRN
jgi:uncharacterized protein